jgi:hypothetical protein
LDACRAETTKYSTELRYAVSVGSFGNLFKIYENARAGCIPARSAQPEALPIRHKFGSDIPPLNFLAGWLIGTESQALSLLVGLVGFGLFGALVSSYVRASEHAPIVPDFLGVLCRGGSAAIIVFLAAYGGISIIAQQQTDPNPYVVFATCLVGAVFGEDVWRWARSQFVPSATTSRSDVKEPETAVRHKDAAPSA